MHPCAAVNMGGSYGMHQPKPQGIITTRNQSTKHQFFSFTMYYYVQAENNILENLGVKIIKW